MSVALTGTGGLFTRWGKEINLVNQVDAFRGPTTDALVSGIYAQYNSNDQIAVDTLYQNRDGYRSVHSSWVSQIIQVAKTTAIEQVNRDETLTSKTLANAVTVLVRQMGDNSESINKPTVAATAAADGDNDGSGVLVASVTGPDGLQQDYALAETFDFTVTTGSTAYAETVQVAGDPSRVSTEYNWPGGSGVSSSITVVNAANSTQVSNGSFEDWSSASAAPTSWLLVTGAWGTTLTRSASPVRTTESYALAMVSDGATQLRFRQQVTLLPSTVYALNSWMKIDSAAAGTLVVKLVDGSGTTVNDEAGTANSLSIDTATDLATSYASESAFFRTPRLLPSTVYLDFHFTSPPANGRTVTIDLVALTAASLLYAGGPFVSLFSGATANPAGDAWTLTVTNSLGNTSFARSLDRILDLRGLGIKVPSSNSPTINDNLIG